MISAWYSQSLDQPLVVTDSKITLLHQVDK